MEGFSNEDLDSAKAQLLYFLDQLPHTFHDFKLDQPFFGQIKGVDGLLEERQEGLKEDIFPSVLFALEGILLQLTAPKSSAISYQVNDLIILDSKPDVIRDKNRLYSETVKIKIGKHAPFLERQMILEILKDHPEIKKVRLDGNKNIGLSNLMFYDIDKLEYLENPLTNCLDYDKVELPIALDEDIDLALKGPLPKCVVALVYKPKVRLGISGMVKAISLNPNLHHVLTHSYEESYGRELLKKLPLWIPELNCGYLGLKFKD